jgi:subtilisin-like proprotein convertase family protein
LPPPPPADAFPVAIPGTAGGSTLVTLSYSDTSLVSQLRVCLKLTYGHVADLVVTLSKGSTTVRLMRAPDASVSGTTFAAASEALYYCFSDAATATLPYPTNMLVLPGDYKPVDALSVFDGQVLGGSWTLTVTTLQGRGVGSIASVKFFMPTCSTGEWGFKQLGPPAGQCGLIAASLHSTRCQTKSGTGLRAPCEPG